MIRVCLRHSHTHLPLSVISVPRFHTFNVPTVHKILIMPLGKRHQGAKQRKERRLMMHQRAMRSEGRTMVSQGVLFKRNGIIKVGTSITNENYKAIIRESFNVLLSRGGKQCTVADVRKALKSLTGYHFVGAHQEITKRKRRPKPVAKAST